MSANRATGKPINSPAILPEFLHIWKWFIDLNRTRSSGFQVEAINYQEIKAYFDVRYIEALPVELDVLEMIDSEYMAIARELSKEK